MLKTKLIMIAMLVLGIAFTSCNKDKEELIAPEDEDPTAQGCLINRIDLTDEDADTLGMVTFHYNNQNQLEFTREHDTQTGQIVNYYKYLRNAAGKINKVEFYDNAHTLISYTEHDFNVQNQMIESRWYYITNGNLRLDEKLSFEYNSKGQISKVTDYLDINTNPQPYMYQIYTYDAAGNPTETKFYEIGTGAAGDSLVGSTTNSFESQHNPWKQLYLPEIWYTPREILLITSPNVIKNINVTINPDPSFNADVNFINHFSADGKLTKQEIAEPFGGGSIIYNFSYQCQ